MNSKLYPLQKTGHLSCIWVPTGEPKTPLACVWVDSTRTASPATSSPDDDEGGMRLCA
jgi:hypothetical protein